MNTDEQEYVIEPSVEELILEFKYKVKPTDIHQEIMNQMEIYWRENEKFMQKKNRSAARRARKALLAIYHLVRARRIEMLASYKAPDFYSWNKHKANA
jgi:hypothetical protein